MDFQFDQFSLLVVCLMGLIVFSAYSIRTVRKFGIAGYLRGLLFAAKAIIRAISKLVMGFISLMAASADPTGDEELSPWQNGKLPCQRLSD